SSTDAPAGTAAMPPVPGETWPRGSMTSSNSEAGTTLPHGPPTTAPGEARPPRIPPPRRPSNARSVTPPPTSPPPRPARGAARPRDGAGQPDHLGARALVGPERGEPRAAAGDDPRDRREGLDVVDHRGLAPEARLDGKRRARARLRAAPLDRLEQRGLLAEDE